MRSHLLGMLEPASLLQVDRHTHCAPGMTPDWVRNPAFRGRLRIAAQALCRFSARPVRAVPACSKVAHRIRPKAGLGQRFYCDYTDVFGALIFVQFNAYLLKSGTRK